MASKVPRSIERRQFCKFFGVTSAGDDLKVVFGVYHLLASSLQETGRLAPRVEKRYLDGRSIKLHGGDRALTPDVIRAYSYISQEIAKHSSGYVPIESDEEAVNNLHHTFVTIGGPMMNELTELAMQDESNKFLEFDIPDEILSPHIKLRQKSNGGNEPPFEVAQGMSEGVDHGLVLVIRNTRFPERRWIVCAGVGSWGTSGAAYYLSRHWRTLYREFGSNDFGIVLHVKRGVDSSARRVHG